MKNIHFTTKEILFLKDLIQERLAILEQTTNLLNGSKSATADYKFYISPLLSLQVTLSKETTTYESKERSAIISLANGYLHSITNMIILNENQSISEKQKDLIDKHDLSKDILEKMQFNNKKRNESANSTFRYRNIIN